MTIGYSDSFVDSHQCSCNRSSLYEDLKLNKFVPLHPGSFLGSLSSLPGHQLGARVIEEVLARASVQSGEVSEVIMGQVCKISVRFAESRQNIYCGASTQLRYFVEHF